MKRIRLIELLSHNLTQIGVLPPDMWAEYLATTESVDLIHIFGFSAAIRLIGAHRNVPLILGASTNSYSDLKFYHQWADPRIKRARAVKRTFLRMVGAYDSSLRPERAARIVTWSDFARRLHLDEGFVRSEQMVILPPGLPPPDSTRRAGLGDCITFLFVGRDFERKNGPLVLEAFRTIHRLYPNTRLVLVGMPADGKQILEEGVRHHLYIPRQQLLDEIYPMSDVLLLPSRAEGFGLAIVEAMSYGIPAIAVNAWAMPEIVHNGDNGLLISPDSLDELTASMKHLAGQPGLLAHMRQRTAETFYRKFSIDAHNRCLEGVYQQALTGGAGISHSVTTPKSWLPVKPNADRLSGQ